MEEVKDIDTSAKTVRASRGTYNKSGVKPRNMTPLEKLELEDARARSAYKLSREKVVKGDKKPKQKGYEEYLIQSREERHAKKLEGLETKIATSTPDLAWFLENQDKILAGQNAVLYRKKLTRFHEKRGIYLARIQKPDEAVVSPGEQLVAEFVALNPEVLAPAIEEPIVEPSQ